MEVVDISEDKHKTARKFLVGGKHAVDVTHTVKMQNGKTSIFLSARCGESTHGHFWGIGEDIDQSQEDGAARMKARPEPPTAEELQSMLDTLRSTVAHEAAWKEQTRLYLNGLT